MRKHITPTDPAVDTHLGQLRLDLERLDLIVVSIEVLDIDEHGASLNIRCIDGNIDVRRDLEKGVAAS